MEIEVRKYTSKLKNDWDDLVSSSKNGTFLLLRDFMDYHSNRFTDFSLLFYHKNKLVALLPAHTVGDILFSHQGLTYGGLIQSPQCTVKMVLSIFDSMQEFLRHHCIQRMIYKAIPSIYHQIRAEEDLYALFVNKASLKGRSISSCVEQTIRLRYSELRSRGIKKARERNLKIEESNDFASFWIILEQNLKERFQLSPVHSLEEIDLLKKKFPTYIRCFIVSEDDSIVGGCVIFETPLVAHVQYNAASLKGKECGALDFLFDYLLQQVYKEKPFFDFGISTEQEGLFLNEGLISQKEGFGARGVVYDIYQLQII